MNEKAKRILCLDFDGVIHSYKAEWQGPDVIPDPPVPGAIAFLHEAVKHFRVAIYSSRSSSPEGMIAMQDWLEDWLISNARDDSPDELGAVADVIGAIEWPTEKPAACVTIDDRALTFTGKWPSMEELLAFKPWNKKDD